VCNFVDGESVAEERLEIMINRQKVWQKYNGHCAYCGEEITIKNMHMDHIIPVADSYKYPGIDLDREDNRNPACRKCNNFKFRWDIEKFRHELEMQVSRLKRVSQFDRALRYGLLEITCRPVIFYFEKKVVKNERKR